MGGWCYVGVCGGGGEVSLSLERLGLVWGVGVRRGRQKTSDVERDGDCRERALRYAGEDSQALSD